MKYLGTAVVLFALLACQARVSAQTGIEAAFEQFWAAGDVAAVDEAVDAIAESGISFGEAYNRLRRGRAYEAAETGTLLRSYQGEDGAEYYYHLVVPDDYDPAREYPLRFYLHGGIGGRLNNRPRSDGEVRLDSDVEQIHVLPYAWSSNPWWDDRQVENLRRILRRVKRNYNVDENRVVLSGVSDGGTGAFYVAMREATRFASFQSLIGHIMVLADRSIADGTSFPVNLINKPWLIVNGENDRLYPTSRVTPVVEYLQRGGVDIEYHPMAGAGHTTNWWPEMRDTFEDFVADNPRRPHPRMLRWKTNGERHNRVHWLVVDETETAFRNEGVAEALAVDRAGTMFRSYDEDAGTMSVTRDDNLIEIYAEGIGGFRLLLSPDVFDFDEAVTVTVNNQLVFQDRVRPNLRTLLEWAARDHDRKMLYGVELDINFN